MRADDESLSAGLPFRPRSTLVFLAGAIPAFALMIVDVRSGAWGVLLGAVAIVVAALGLLDLLGTFDDTVEPRRSIALRELGAPSAALAASLAALIVSLRAAVAGVLPSPILTAAVLITAGCVGVLASGFWWLRRLGALGEEPDEPARPWSSRHGLWLLAVTIVLYVPMLGSYSLFDPWETHYGEVAREMIARDDWISLWWAQERWFFSKPVLDFWLQGLSFLLLGVRWQPDAMLAGVAEGRFPQPEWAVRFPVLVLALGAIYLLYRASARVFGRRAGFLGALVLATTPYWFFLAHQSMTDMPYVAPLAGALALVALGLRADPEAVTPSYELRAGKRRFRVSAAHGLFVLVIATALPQILYLCSRNLTLFLAAADRGFQLHGDLFFSGSGGGNCGLPGNDPCQWASPVNPVFQPAVGGLIWGIALGLWLLANRGERRVARLCYLGAWYLTALALLAKGAPGLVLPVLVALVAVCAAKRFADLPRLELPGLLLLLACVALPWYVQAFMRHGTPFTDRLLFHDMYKRAFVHVHDTNQGDDVSFRYYVWQLGYGLFPWTGVAAAGLVHWLREPDEATSRRGELGALLGLWAVLAFSMFAVSLTKFHHYALPVVPPLALLTGVVLDRMLERGAPSPRRLVAYGAGILISAICLVLGVTCFGAGSVFGAAVDHQPSPGASPVTGALLLAIGLLAFAATIRLARTPENPGVAAEPFDSATLGLLGLAAAGVVLLVGRDLYQDGRVDGDARLLHLFVYNYRRPWPPSLDFSSVLFAFTIVGAAACALSALPRLRAHGAALLVGTSVAFTAFGLNVYLVQAAPHWGQRETVMRYYATRASAKEPLVAFQMNWKGENFYTGNRLPAFVTTGSTFQSWIAEARERGMRVAYFTTEHSRVGILKHELGAVKSFSVLTTPELNNKFMLARVEF